MVFGVPGFGILRSKFAKPAGTRFHDTERVCLPLALRILANSRIVCGLSKLLEYIPLGLRPRRSTGRGFSCGGAQTNLSQDI